MALTEMYVSAVAGGGGSGTSAGSPFTFAQMASQITGGGGKSKRYNIKNDGTYARSSYDSWNGISGTNFEPIILRGYNTTIGDGYLGRAADNGDLITTNMPLISYTGGAMNSGKFMVFESLRWTSNHNDYTVSMETATSVFGCTLVNTGTGSDSAALRPREGGLVWECDCSTTALGGLNNPVISCQGSGGRIIACRVFQSSVNGIGIGVERWVGIFSTLIKGPGTGIGLRQGDINWPFTLINCTVTGWTDAIQITSANNWASVLWGNMVTDNAGYAVNGTTTGNMVFLGPNRTRANALGDMSSGVEADWQTCGRFWPLVTGAGSDYVNAAGNDYNLISTSPARQANRPLWLDIGAYDMKDPSGGGGGSAVFNPLAQTIIRPA